MSQLRLLLGASREKTYRDHVNLHILERAITLRKLECVSRVNIHMSITGRCPPVTEEVHKLMNTLLITGQKIPECGGILEIRLGVPLLSVNECWKFDAVPNKEDWRVVPNHIPVPFFSVKLYGKAMGISC